MYENQIARQSTPNKTMIVLVSKPIYMCVYIYIYICIYMRAHARVHTRTHARTHTQSNFLGWRASLI